MRGNVGPVGPVGGDDGRSEAGGAADADGNERRGNAAVASTSR